MRISATAISALLMLALLAPWGSVGAQVIPESAGAAVALPILTNNLSRRETFAVVTNHGASNVSLRVHLIDEDDWAVEIYVGPVTPKEVTLFVVEPISSTQAKISFECTDLQSGQALPFALTTPVTQGILFVTLIDPVSGDTINPNVLTGDATVVEFLTGVAFSVPGFHFQGINQAAPGVADREFRFDGVEYSRFPSSLATNFVAPVDNPNIFELDLSAELFLFTLDGTAGISPDAGLSILFYNDDEQAFSTNHNFACMDIVDLLAIDARFQRNVLGSDTGHMTLTPQIATQSDGTHDEDYDGGIFGDDGLRRTPVLGWRFEILGPTGDLIGSGPTNQAGGKLGFATRLASNKNRLIPSLGDVVVFAAPDPGP